MVQKNMIKHIVKDLILHTYTGPIKLCQSFSSYKIVTYKTKLYGVRYYSSAQKPAINISLDQLKKGVLNINALRK